MPAVKQRKKNTFLFDLCIENARVVTPKGILRGSVAVKGGIIKEVGESGLHAVKKVNAQGAWLLPGFFDTHLHGGAGFDSSCGRFDVAKGKFINKDDEYQRGIENVLRLHAKHGTTSMILSTATNSEENISRFMHYGGQAAWKYAHGAILRGLDIEGVFIKHAAYAGAQSLNYLRVPDRNYIDRMMKLSGGALKRILFAPEYGKPALEAIRHCGKLGIVPGVGHSGASYDEMMHAYEAGVKVFIHFGNGPMSQNFKSGGVIDAAFTLRDAVCAELICDGHHVNPKWIVSFLKNFKWNAVGVSDAMFVTGMAGQLKEFEMGGKICLVSKDVLRVKGGGGTLFGSVLTMDKAFENFVNIFTSNLEGYLTGPLFDKPQSIDQAVVRASGLLSANPARLYGLQRSIGSIEKGKRADLLIMDIHSGKGRYICKVGKVFVGGIDER